MQEDIVTDPEGKLPSNLLTILKLKQWLTYHDIDIPHSADKDVLIELRDKHISVLRDAKLRFQAPKVTLSKNMSTKQLRKWLKSRNIDFPSDAFRVELVTLRNEILEEEHLRSILPANQRPSWNNKVFNFSPYHPLRAKITSLEKRRDFTGREHEILGKKL